MTRNVLITGAAGEIGSFLVAHLPAEKYSLSLADIRQPDYDHSLSFAELDISDLAQFEAACAGIDTVVHLAADRRTFAPWETLLPANIIGAYNAFEAAHRAGCRRVVFASSIHTGTGYPREIQISPEMLTRPGNLYGASKVWGEAVARVYADQHGLSCLCLRFGWVGDRSDHEKLSHPFAPASYITYEDITHLIEVSIDAPDDVRYGIFNGVSDNRHKKLDITNGREILGYDPQDDGFELRKALGIDD